MKKLFPGFLLIEALMAIALMSIACLIIGSYWHSMATTYTAAQNKLDAITLAHTLLAAGKRVAMKSESPFWVQRWEHLQEVSWGFDVGMITITTVQVSWKERGNIKKISMQTVE